MTKPQGKHSFNGVCPGKLTAVQGGPLSWTTSKRHLLMKMVKQMSFVFPSRLKSNNNVCVRKITMKRISG
jgi:hypothetical protein